MTSVQWYPGHMTKARRQVTADLAKVDVVLELLDARIPMSSRNPDIDKIIGEKPRIILLNKADLADSNFTKTFIDYFAQNNLRSIAIEASTGKGFNLISPAVEKASVQLLEKWKQKGMRPRAFRAMVVGIPNVGKSSVINRLARARKTVTANRPGVTRGQQWVKVSDKLELLDTPGILWPKFDDPLVGLKLAATGAVSDFVTNLEEIAFYALQVTEQRSSAIIKERYHLDCDAVPHEEWLEKISRRFGFLVSGGKADTIKGSKQVLQDFRAGKLGKHTLDSTP
ncbi:ribosome biogenesis GTPase YlqF [Heliorestis acidaminivorans]|uniref:Ribosome biogenesis GTPase A n=1 Tax=Heliorestis acidaminivorans TaxID=553427 RepID=A0A6I0EUI4_9FIRM|nr:ribosome biogenesis GTPase YlqF [Heliorestis acidaminivorans]KAB2954425.1 ribosome biogenesis GTPase YlqF [Heliorestis acidaminivorans]